MVPVASCVSVWSILWQSLQGPPAFNHVGLDYLSQGFSSLMRSPLAIALLYRNGQIILISCSFPPTCRRHGGKVKMGCLGADGGLKSEVDAGAGLFDDSSLIAQLSAVRLSPFSVSHYMASPALQAYGLGGLPPSYSPFFSQYLSWTSTTSQPCLSLMVRRSFIYSACATSIGGRPVPFRRQGPSPAGRPYPYLLRVHEPLVGEGLHGTGRSGIVPAIQLIHGPLSG